MLCNSMDECDFCYCSFLPYFFGNYACCHIACKVINLVLHLRSVLGSRNGQKRMRITKRHSLGTDREALTACRVPCTQWTERKRSRGGNVIRKKSYCMIRSLENKGKKPILRALWKGRQDGKM